MMGRTYIETFDDGPGGWWGIAGNLQGEKAIEIREGVAISRSPWWIDYNHAPPGGGYLHLLYCLMTTGPGFTERLNEIAGPNRFVKGGFPTDFTNAKMTLRLKGELKARGAKLSLLIQAKVGDVYVSHVLTGQSFDVKPEWSEETITLANNPEQWRCMGTRHDRTDFYGSSELADVLSDVNCNIMLTLHPLDVVPMGPIDGDPHLLRAGRDYPVWQSRLPEGYTMLDEVRIELAGQ